MKLRSDRPPVPEPVCLANRQAKSKAKGDKRAIQKPEIKLNASGADFGTDL
jgi:hypothetical protein